MGNRDETREDLIEFLGTICRAGKTLDAIDDEQNLVEADFMDSLAIVQIILYLEQSHGVNLRNSGVDPSDLSTLAGILGIIAGSGK